MVVGDKFGEFVAGQGLISSIESLRKVYGNDVDSIDIGLITGGEDVIL